MCGKTTDDTQSKEIFFYGVNLFFFIFGVIGLVPIIIYPLKEKLNLTSPNLNNTISLIYQFNDNNILRNIYILVVIIMIILSFVALLSFCKKNKAILLTYFAFMISLATITIAFLVMMNFNNLSEDTQNGIE
jgi:hypothetical protein